MEAKSNKNSTLAISQSESQRLDRFCKKIGVTKKEYISTSLDYFKLHGIDPTSNENPKTEITKIFVRIEDLFAFNKAQETKILMPTLKKIIEMDLNSKRNSSEKLDKIGAVLQELLNEIRNK